MRLGPGLSFSWRRAFGISAAKGRISRALGVPLTRSGRQRKLGRLAGCSTWIGIIALTATVVACVAR